MLCARLLRARLVKLIDNYPADNGANNGRAKVWPTALRLRRAMGPHMTRWVVISLALPVQTMSPATGLGMAAKILDIDKVVKDRILWTHVENSR